MVNIATTITFDIGKAGKIKSNTHKRLEKALKDAIKDKDQKLSDEQAKLLQKANELPSRFDDAKREMDDLYAKLKYNQSIETVDGKTVHVYQKTDQSLTPDFVQQKRLDSLQNDSMNYEQAYAELVDSNRYKQAKNHFKKLNDEVQKAYNNLFKYETKRHVQEIKKDQHVTNFDDILAPHAQIFETNSSDGFTLYLFAQSENEANTSDITKYPTDRDDPISDHVRKSDKTLTISGYLRGPKSYPHKTKSKLKSAEYYYQKLLKWETGGTQLSYRSNSSSFTQQFAIPHVYMKHLYVQSLNKDLQQATADSIKIDLTLAFVYPATVLTNKRNLNFKGKKSKNGKYAGAKHVTAKRGTTFYQLAKQYGTTVSQLKKWNGATLKSGSKVQVTQGQLVTKPKRTTKSKIYQGRGVTNGS